MKFTAIIFLSACLTASATGFSQITLAEKNAPLQKIFKELQKQSGYDFLFSYTALEKAGNATVMVKNVSLKEAVEEVLKGKNLTYEILEKTVIIKPKTEDPKELNILSGAEGLTTIDVSGKVTDNEGLPLAGASVKVKGTTNGTTTDATGVFVLKGVDENAVLIFSYAEHETVELKVSGRTTVTAALKRSEAELKEVVINKGYYSEKQKFSVGNVTHIGKEVIEQQPVQNPLLALQGRVPGLEVTQLTGVAGGGVTVRIQGVNSISSGLEPLIVVDGVPYPTQLANSSYDQSITQGGSPLNYINPSDIESIDILKDADATAIYGSRAANGAILITTKKGKVGKSKLVINLQQGWGKVGHKVDMMNTQQYLQMRWEALGNSGKMPSSNPSALSPYIYAPDLFLWDTTRNTDWQKTLIGGTAQYTDIQASLSGGTSTIQYLVGGNFKRQTTVFPGSFDDKLGSCHFSINGTTPNQRLQLQFTGSYSYDQNHLPGVDLTGPALTIEPNAPPLYNSDGSLNWSQDASGTSTWTNPLAYTANADFYNNAKNLISNVLIRYNILPGLTLNGSVGFNNLQTDVYRPTRLEFYKPERRPSSQPSSNIGSRNMNSWIIEPQLKYTRDIFKGKLDVLLGTTIQKSSYDFLSITGYGFSNDLLMKTLSAASSIKIGLHKSGVTRYNALFGRLGYNWGDKYLVNLTGRRDGSNRFGDANKFHNFWSIGAGWIFSEEKWFQNNLRFISFGKLRSSYGTTGNDGIPDFSYLSLYDISNPTVLYQGNIGLVANNISNPHIQWEETRKWQTGLDLGFFHDKVIIGATYIRNRSSNLLVQNVLPNVTGFNLFAENLAATIQNSNWEFSISTTNVKTEYFTWKTSANLTIPQNKLLSFPGIENTAYASGGNGVKVGEPLGIIQANNFGGVNPVNGAYFFLDQNNNSNATVGGNNKYLSQLSSYYGGLTNTLSFKGFQLDVLFQFVKKKGPRDMYFYNGSQYPGEFFGGYSNQPVTVLNRWQKPGDITNVSLYSAIGGIYTLTPLLTSDAWYSYDASFVRLKNLSLSWQIPRSVIEKAHIQSVRLYIHGQNLATITKYTGLDPESMSTGGLPPLKIWTIGAQVDF